MACCVLRPAGVQLTFIDANHCPGAAMIIAQPPGGPPVLHTGDCRLAASVRAHPALAALVGRRCTLVLDTTYCDPRYSFPSQEEVVASVVEACQAERFNKRYAGASRRACEIPCMHASANALRPDPDAG